MKATAQNHRREIREKAEKTIQEKTQSLQKKLSKEDVNRLVHELGVHQVELEMQNEELREAQEALEVSRRRYADLYEFAPAGYFTFDKFSNILELNQTAALLLGSEKSNLLNKLFSKFLAELSDRASFLKLLHDSFIDPLTKPIDIRIRKRDNSVFEGRLQIVGHDGSIETDRRRAMLIDITERKQLEEALRQSKENYRILFDKSPLAKWVIDLETFGFLEVNEAAIEHYGYSWEEFRDLTLADISTEELVDDHCRQAVEKARSKGTKLEGRFQTKHRKKNKDIIDVDIRCTEIEYSGRRAILTAIVDITDRKRAEEVLRQSEQRLRAIFDNAAMGIVEVDAESCFIGANNRASAITGYGVNELIGMSVQNVTAPEDREMSRRLNAELRQGQRSVLDYEKRYLRRDGSRVWVHVMVSPIRDQDNRFIRAIGTIEEISGRKRSEEELKKTVEELERSNRELQQFAYVASHDLQEPLRTVSSYVDLLAMRYKGKIDPTADKYISFAVEGANRMSELINDLLVFSRVTTKANPLTRVNMGEALERALGNLRKSIKESSAAITKDEMPEVVADPIQMPQLFQNLVANAIKFRRKDAKPYIHISAERKPGEWVFGVQDNGIGIEPRFYERIFTIFQRLHTKEEYPGTGVGLAICKRIVERHGGRIWVESKPGEGSTFYFTLPAGQ